MSDLSVPKQSGGNRSALSREVVVAGVDQRELVESEVLQLSSRLDAAQRVAAACARERQRIGQDLHDGAQQRLTALRIRLAIAAREFESREETDASLRFSDFVEEVDQAIDELRNFVQGVYPVLLTSRGLSMALAAASSARLGRSPSSRTVLSGTRPRSRRPSTFCCLAALDNVAKHAGPSETTVRIWDQDELCFSIRDTGRGFDPQRLTAGAGIANMRDRIDAVGGDLTIDSTSQGTIVKGSVPHAG